MSDPYLVFIMKPIIDATNEQTVPGAKGEFPVGQILTVKFNIKINNDFFKINLNSFI